MGAADTLVIGTSVDSLVAPDHPASSSSVAKGNGRGEGEGEDCTHHHITIGSLTKSKFEKSVQVW